MALIDVTAKKDGKECAVQFDFGDNLQDATEKWGDEVVFTGFRADAKVDLQAGLRRCLVKGADPTEHTKTFKPGVRTVGAAARPTIDSMKAEFATMNVDAKKKFLADLRSSV